ncbi:DUF4194 domain-containing protein [Thermogemmatispora tikiterensis]|uniref:DUF4194 domain-containing protein n=1 Tax=Thermogemmatispora tikiterensis TaxID=1825093 RepID=A0A328VB55_9CHLR|nr:DUF4194 domain-containing protein [Thermogemmatispora tikiterensis]RAQ93971.1 hypothetical protein A4R35_00405 [Thermogemmatispora tikiterensis]
MKGGRVLPYASVILRLLQGAVFSDDHDIWSDLLQHQPKIEAYFEQIGLELRVDENSGLAYLLQPEIEDDEGRSLRLPRLTRRDRLSYIATLLCVVLRDRLLCSERDSFMLEPLLCSYQQLVDWCKPYLPERHDERKTEQQIEKAIERLIELNFLRAHGQGQDAMYEVRPLLKAKLDVETLEQLKERLRQYGKQRVDGADAAEEL